MTSVLGLDEAKIDELCRKVEPQGRLWKANLLGPGNIVVSGELAALAAVDSAASELGAGRVVALKVAGAFHSPLMQPADDQLAEILAHFVDRVAHGCRSIPMSIRWLIKILMTSGRPW